MNFHRRRSEARRPTFVFLCLSRLNASKETEKETRGRRRYLSARFAKWSEPMVINNTTCLRRYWFITLSVICNFSSFLLSLFLPPLTIGIPKYIVPTWTRRPVINTLMLNTPRNTLANCYTVADDWWIFLRRDISTLTRDEPLLGARSFYLFFVRIPPLTASSGNLKIPFQRFIVW